MSHDDHVGLLVIHDFKFLNHVDSKICSQALYVNMYQVLLLLIWYFLNVIKLQVAIFLTFAQKLKYHINSWVLFFTITDVPFFVF